MKRNEFYKEILILREQGKTLEEIGKIWGLSKQRISQIIKLEEDIIKNKNEYQLDRKRKMAETKERQEIEYQKRLERNRLSNNKSATLYHRKQRTKVIELLGGKCSRCGFDKFPALQIDHINGHGNREHSEFKKKGGHGKFLKKILTMENPHLEYQILCANCNWIKRSENNETAAGYRIKD